MGKITVSGTMSHSVDRVWSMLDDFGSVYLWSAGVESSPIIGGTPERGVGAERLCTLYDGNRISERVIESVDERNLVVDIYDTTMPLKSARGRFDLEKTSDGGTLVRITFEYVVKYGVLGKVMDALIIKRSLKKSFDNMLAALVEHLATGVHIQKGWQPTAAAA
ncbi:MAG: SRPBCC family protein [Deltaproteobacteria bacterium]|nr:SRPBCC family protein [Deltaproteobacteria bacterium]